MANGQWLMAKKILRNWEVIRLVIVEPRRRKT